MSSPPRHTSGDRQTGSDTYPPRGARIGSLSALQQRRSPSPLPRTESNESTDSSSPAIMTRVTKGIKKVFGRKEVPIDENESCRMDGVAKEKHDVQGVFLRVLAQIKAKPKLKKRATIADLRTTTGTETSDRRDSLASGGSVLEAETVTDGMYNNEHGRQVAIGHLSDKIKRTGEAIRKEQALMDEHLKDFLRQDAPYHKKQKLKSQFEMRNNKSKIAIDNFQKKIEKYQAKIKNLEQGGGMLKGMMVGLRGVKENILDTLSRGASGAASLMRRTAGRQMSANAAIPATQEADTSSLNEEMEERPLRLVGGSEDSADALSQSGDNQSVSEVSLIVPTVQDLKEKMHSLNDAYAASAKTLEELRELQAEQKEAAEQLRNDLKKAQEERRSLQSKLGAETASLREILESQYHDLCESHQDMHTEMDQLQERLGLFEYQTGERFAETDDRLGSFDIRLSQLQHDKECQGVSPLRSPTYKRALLAKPLSFLLNVVSGLIAVVSGLLSPVKIYKRQKWRWTCLLLIAIIFLFFVLIYF